jgi:hypothetical protein
MGAKKPKMAASIRSIHAVLLNDWDPIGVQGVPDAENEYDGYSLPIYKILQERRSEAALLDYLKWMLQRMGLTTSESNLRSVAGKLLEINVSGDEE